jgi:D-alanyl-D-alanine dipeptidase
MRQYFLLLLLAFFAAAYAQQPENPYGLEILSDPRLYREAIAVDENQLMIDLAVYIPGIVLDIRYATANNFTGQQVYDTAAAFLRKPVAEALLRAQLELRSKGLGLKVFDAYRPYRATLKFFRVYPDKSFVAAPWLGSRHNRGAAVDLTLIDLSSGQELLMPTLFDDFTERASPSYMDLPEEAIRNREKLINIMSKHGFSVFHTEWWHYDFRGWEQFGLMDIDLKDL